MDAARRAQSTGWSIACCGRAMTRPYILAGMAGVRVDSSKQT